MYFTSKNHLFPQLLKEWLVRNLKFKGHPPLFMNPWKVGHNLTVTSVTSVGCVDWELSTSHIAKVPSMTASNVCLGRSKAGCGWEPVLLVPRFLTDRVFSGNWQSERGEHTQKVQRHTFSYNISANPYLTITSGTLQHFLWRRSIPIHEKHRFPRGCGARTIARTSVLVPEVRKEMPGQCGWILVTSRISEPSWKWKFGKLWFMSNKSFFRFHASLVGGWTNPFEAY